MLKCIFHISIFNIDFERSKLMQVQLCVFCCIYLDYFHIPISLIQFILQIIQTIVQTICKIRFNFLSLNNTYLCFILILSSVLSCSQVLTTLTISFHALCTNPTWYLPPPVLCSRPWLRPPRVLPSTPTFPPIKSLPLLLECPPLPISPTRIV